MPRSIPFVLVAFVVATIGAEFATVFNNAMMPSLVPPERLGRLSGTGWAIGYVGGLVSLLIMLGFLAADPQTGKTLLGFAPLFGLDPAAREGDRAAGPLTAHLVHRLHSAAVSVHARRAAKLRPLRAGGAAGACDARAIRCAHCRSIATLALFLLANMIYADGLVALFAFGGIYAAGTFGWGTIEIGIFGILLTITGTLGALARRQARRPDRPEARDPRELSRC